MKKHALVLVFVVLAVLVGCAEHEHSWKLVSETAPTREAEGEKRYECITCGAEKVDVISALKDIDLGFLDAYKEDATKVPDGFSFKDSKYDEANTAMDEIVREVHIESKEALLYYAYKFDKAAAYAACTEHGEDGKSYCIWYQNSCDHSGVKYITNVYLDCDIDFENEVLTEPMKIYGTTLKGQGHVIKNAYVYGTAESNGNAGLFFLGNGGKDSAVFASIDDLKIDNVHVETDVSFNENAHAGILVSVGVTSVSNVTITNSSVKGGKYTGAIAGFIYGGSITGCTVEDCSISGQYKIGGAVGQIESGNGDVKGNSFKNVGIKVENLLENKTAVVGKVVGDYNCNGECSGNAFEGSLPEESTKWIGKIESGMEVTGTN